MILPKPIKTFRLRVVEMRKKDLLTQNTQLFDKISEAQLSISRLEKEIEKRDTEIDGLKKEIESLNAKINATEPLKALEKKVIKQAALSTEVDYGASVIGKIVVEAAKCCNSVTEGGNPELSKELVNLILGRTEVAKSEILGIVSSDESFETKKQKIDTQYENAVDYFISVTAQLTEG